MGNRVKFFDSAFLYSFLTPLTDKSHVCIAYSGGLDSHTLLHAMAALRHEHPEYRVRAVHVHHGLSPQADHWAAHCEKVCADLSLDYCVKHVTLDLQSGDSVEALARAARYEVFSEILEPEECLLTAHTQDDQAETLLLQLFRGAGVKGLAAMPAKKPLGKGFLLRPVLPITREALQDYAARHDLTWVEDESNHADRFDRNYLRRHILPVIKNRWPQALDTVARSAAHCAAAADGLEEWAASDLSQVQCSASVLSISALKALSPVRRSNVLRYWLHSQGCRLPSTQQLQRIEQDFLVSDPGAAPVFRLQNRTLQRYRDQLFLLSEPASAPISTSESWRWDMQGPLNLPGHGQLMISSTRANGLSADIGEVTVRFRQGGERCQPMGRVGEHPLKKLFQEWGVPPWQRNAIPLLYDKDQIVAVVGHCVCEGYGPIPSAQGRTVRWLKSGA